LELWIDDERVSGARDNDSSVLERHSVCWESLSLPDCLVCSASEHLKWVDSLSDGDILLNDIWNPLLSPKFVSEDVVEWSNVRDESGG